MKEDSNATCPSPVNPLKRVDTCDDGDDPRLKTVRLGVWTLTLGKEKTKARLKWPFPSPGALCSHFALVRRIFSEVWRVDPWAVAFLVLYHFFEAIEYSIILYFSGRLLKQIELVLVSATVDKAAILSAIVARLSCFAVVAWVRWWNHATMPRLEGRVIRHFKTNLLTAKLRTDLPTSLKPSTTGRVSASSVWDAFCQVFHLCASILNVASLMTFIIASCRSAVGVGPVFPLICLVEPVLVHLERRSLWPMPHVVHTENEAFLRSKRLSKMAKQEQREEVISAGIREYIIEEFKKAGARLRDTPTEDVNGQYDRRATPTFNILCKLAGDLPIVYCVLCAIYGTGNLSVTSIAMLERGASNFRAMVSVTLRYVQRFGDYIRVIEQYYKTIEAPEKENLLAEGQLPYPSPTSSDAGMGFELRNVTFGYPGSLDRPSLRNINVDIKPGQLVVIVGANGSGKSTLIKLLTRLYDPTFGTLKVDGQPLAAYRERDLRQATAVLSQGHRLFPLSMGENIGLGCVERVRDVDAVRAAAQVGGATACIAKLRHGLDTVLDPQTRAYGENVTEEDDPLRQRLEALDKPTELSGGETQRIVAARTFMRLTSGMIRAVFVDEPSSALDAEGELALFNNLCKERESKTMIFVTHRFGHLTRDADLIICLKDGEIVEQGVHAGLMARGGEYSKLYEIQASAFAADS